VSGPSVTSTATYQRLLRTKHTNQMTAEELARVFAGHYGWGTRAGGWVYDERGRPVVQGWTGLARELERRGWIKPGAGMNWSRIPQTPHFKVDPPKRQGGIYSRHLDHGLNLR